tara:strand:+ start:26 stop:193 length:168 start_codon:yes stop_codon:yes gene_type:complete
LITPVVLNISNQKQVKINKKKRGRSIKPTPNRRIIMYENYNYYEITLKTIENKEK